LTGNIIARRYAKALMDVVSKEEDTDALAGQLKDLAVLIEENARLGHLLYNPSVNVKLKKGILKEIIGRIRIAPVPSKFLNLLLERNRLKYLPAIALVFEELSNDRANRIKAIITTSYELSAETREKLKKKLGEITRKEVLVEEEIDPSLIGGVKVQAGGYVIDGSVKARLGYLKDELLKGVK
jgi:F-type H+-transporting ATPase subunit delta